MKFFLALLIYVFINPFTIESSTDENSALQKILESYRKKDFKEVGRLASEYIKNANDLQQEDKVVKFYFHTENDIQKLDSILDSIYKKTDEVNSKFHTLTYIIMEKALIRDEYEIGVKWGEVFQKEAKSKKQKYVKGLYLYSCLLYKNGKSSQSLAIIDLALKERPSQKITEKLKILRIAQLRNDFQVIVETKNFLKNNYDSTFSDIVFTYMIQSYRNLGKKRRVEQLKEEFKKDFGDSFLSEKVAGI